MDALSVAMCDDRRLPTLQPVALNVQKGPAAKGGGDKTLTAEARENPIGETAVW